MRDSDIIATSQCCRYLQVLVKMKKCGDFSGSDPSPFLVQDRRISKLTSIYHIFFVYSWRQVRDGERVDESVTTNVAKR